MTSVPERLARRLRRASRRLAREERGFTLVELLLGLVMGLIVASAVLTFSEAGYRSQVATMDLTGALSQQREGMERMTREIRQASSLTLTSSQVVDMDTYVRGASGNAELRRVRYDCSSAEVCRRQEGPVGGALSANAVAIVGVVQNADVFDPEPDLYPSFVAVAVRVRTKGTADSPRRVVTLRDGVQLRNRL